jgi:pyrroline-5-carboxylate reductase
MKLGFVGTGTITSAIVRGLGADFGKDSIITLSPRNADLAARLAREFPHVRVAESNQAVLDASDVVMLAVRPQIAREVLGELRFRPDHHVISLIAILPLPEAMALIAPARILTKAVPLPATAMRKGATAIFPSDPVAAGLFNITGAAIQVDKLEIFEALTAATATMASYFTFADAIASWLVQKGLPAADARNYVGTIFQGLALTTGAEAAMDFPTLAVEHATRGGINEQLAKYLTDQGAFADVKKGLDQILARIQVKPAP